MSTPLVSVIVPAYNVQDYLARCLTSILAQSCQDFEILIVNDGSTDHTAAVAEKFQEKDSRISVIHKENGGLASARNAGLDAATGRYISFVDSDDYIEPTLLQTCVDILEKQRCDCCCFGMFKELESGEPLEEIRFKARSVTLHSEEERMAFLLHELLNYRMGWEACSRLFRADIIRAHHLRFVNEREVFAEDLLFSFTFWLYATSCVSIDCCLYHYIQHPDSLMGQSRRRNVLPQVHQLSKEACRAVEQAKLSLIRQDFIAIYLHLMEWQARPYVASKGMDWVRQELFTLGQDVFCREISTYDSFTRLWRKYGPDSGFVTVCLTILSPDDVLPAQRYLDALLRQTLQKLDILVLHRKDSPICSTTPRVRCLSVNTADPQELVRTAFREGYGEYLYFADLHHPLPVDFLERNSDILKYNACGTVILQENPSRFYDRNAAQQRQELQQRLRKNRPASYCAMVRCDLLSAEYLTSSADLSLHMEEILLSNHVLFVQESFPE